MINSFQSLPIFFAGRPGSAFCSSSHWRLEIESKTGFLLTLFHLQAQIADKPD